MIAVFNDPDKQVRKEVIDALERLNDTKAIDNLISALKDTNPDVRGSAAYALGKLGNRKAIDPLSAAFDDPDEQVRRKVDIALRTFGIESPNSKSIFFECPVCKKKTASGILLGQGIVQLTCESCDWTGSTYQENLKY